jgi:hypothetical protein
VQPSDQTSLEAAKSGWGVTCRYIAILAVRIGGLILLVMLAGSRAIAVVMSLLR